MAITNSCNKHNMIACVAKTERNADFHEVIDFLTGCYVNYALLVSPDVIQQWIQQFWNTAKERMINEVAHIEAKVAGKKILVSEASVRTDLMFNDEDGTNCFDNQLRAAHSLHTEELDITTSSHHSDDSSAGKKAESPSPVASERPASPNDYTPTDEVQTSGGDEGNLDLYGLTREVLRLKKQNAKQAAQILRLKTKIKILVKKVKPVIAEYSSFVKIKATLSKKKKLKKAHKKKSSSFKQGRKKVSDGSTGLNEVDVNSGDSQMMDVDDNISAEVHEGTAEVHEGTAQVNEGTAEVNEGTAEVNESTAGANLSTEPSMKEVEDEAGPSTFQDESDEFIQDDTLIADILVNITRPRRGAGITIPGNIPEQERPESPTLILDPKDKGKGIMKEEPKKKKLTLQQLRAAETANDEEVARKVAAEWEEEEERKRLAGLERLQAELEDNEMIAAEVQRTERENFTEEQKAKFLVETIAAQRRFRAEQQAALRRSKPPTISQLRNQMMKYIRNVGGKAYRNLKNKSYEEIKDIYEKVKRFNDKFVAIGSTEDEQAIKEMNVKAEEPSKKRKGTIRKMKSSRIIKKRKIQKSDDELKNFLKVVDFEGDSAQDVEVMEQRSLISRFSIVQCQPHEENTT
ncbi:hypothetical protein Tco_1413727 [Tanacetum coccineum]